MLSRHRYLFDFIKKLPKFRGGEPRTFTFYGEFNDFLLDYLRTEGFVYIHKDDIIDKVDLIICNQFFTPRMYDHVTGIFKTQRRLSVNRSVMAQGIFSLLLTDVYNKLNPHGYLIIQDVDFGEPVTDNLKYFITSGVYYDVTNETSGYTGLTEAQSPNLQLQLYFKEIEVLRSLTDTARNTYVKRFNPTPDDLSKLCDTITGIYQKRLDKEILNGIV